MSEIPKAVSKIYNAVNLTQQGKSFSGDQKDGYQVAMNGVHFKKAQMLKLINNADDVDFHGNVIVKSIPRGGWPSCINIMLGFVCLLLSVIAYALIKPFGDEMPSAFNFSTGTGSTP